MKSYWIDLKAEGLKTANCNEALAPVRLAEDVILLVLLAKYANSPRRHLCFLARTAVARKPRKGGVISYCLPRALSVVRSNRGPPAVSVVCRGPEVASFVGTQQLQHVQREHIVTSSVHEQIGSREF